MAIFVPLIMCTQNVYFVSPDSTSSDNNSGTINEPWKTWNKAFRTVEPGDTIYLRGGIYYSTERIGMQGWTAPRWFYGPVDNPYSPSGTQDSGIVIMGYPSDVQQGNYPILDCSQHCQNMHLLRMPRYNTETGKTTRQYSPYNPRYNSAITMIDVEYVTLKDFKIRNVYQCDGILNGALTVIGRNITYENIILENISQIGFWYISTAYSEEDSAYIKDAQLWMGSHEHHALMNIVQSRTRTRPLVGPDTLIPAMWWDTVHHRPPDTTRWINCDVSNVCDTLTFDTNDLYNDWGVRKYSQFNDFMIQDTGKFGDAWKVQSFNGNYYSFEGCRAWNYSGDGFDVRGGKIFFKNCWTMPTSMYAHFNTPDGFVTSAFDGNLLNYYDSSYRQQLEQDTMIRFENCLAMFCDGVGFRYGIVGDVGNNPVFYNNTSFGNNVAFSSEVSSTDTIGTYNNNIAHNSNIDFSAFSNYESSYNTWDSNIVVTDDDFVSVVQSELMSLFISPRDSNNSLPDSLPLMLEYGSNLIDAGIYVGNNYNGDAPDIGYSESDYQYDDVLQNIELIQGWNIASFYVQPDSTNMLSIVDPLIQDSTLVKVQDEAGGFIQHIEPYGWLNTIGPMYNTEGYYFYVNNDTDFDIHGELVTLPFNIGLMMGWNIIGHPLDVNQDAMSILQPLIDNNVLIKVMDEAGNFIQHIPPYGWLNTIGNFRPDEGYLVKVSDNDTLTYSQVKSFLPELPLKSHTNCFNELPGNPFMPMNILIDTITTINFDLDNGDEIGVYDGDILCGSLVIDTSTYFQSIVARADDPTTEEIDGYIEGNNILFRYCDKSEDMIYDDVQSDYYWGEEYFTQLGTYIGNIIVNGTIVGIDSETNGYIFLDQNYPNPFNNSTTIEYGINKDGRVLLNIFDMSGRKVHIIEDSYKLSGKYSVNFGDILEPGLYYYQLLFDNVSLTRKMIVY